MVMLNQVPTFSKKVRIVDNFACSENYMGAQKKKVRFKIYHELI